MWVPAWLKAGSFWGVDQSQQFVTLGLGVRITGNAGEEFGGFIHCRWLPRWLSGKEFHLSMQEMWVPSLGQEDLLEKEMAAHSSILAWRTPWREEPGVLQSMGSQRVGHDGVTKQQCTLHISSFEDNVWQGMEGKQEQ